MVFCEGETKTSNTADGPDTSNPFMQKDKMSKNTNPESFAPEGRSPNWDTEADHNMLSYFLGNEQQSMGAAASPNLENPPQEHPIPLESRNYSLAESSRTNANGFLPGGHSDYGHFDDEQVPPPTPATHYYHHSTRSTSRPGKPRNTLVASATFGGQQPRASRNNPMMTIKTSRVNKANSSLDTNLESMSPISPTAMIGSGHERLMLPPPISQTGNSLNPLEATNPPRQSHLEWLQHINAMAKHANVDNPSRVVPPPPQTSAGQPISHTHHLAMPPPASMPYPTAPAPAVGNLPPGYLPNPTYYTHAALHHLQQQTPVPESEEKRAKRLERNRESARKSRRRKKQRLAELEEKVAGLHGRIESLRKDQLSTMGHELRDFMFKQLLNIEMEENTANDGSNSQHQRLLQAFEGSGLNCPIQRAAIDFQYSTLKQAILPKYSKFLLWLTLMEEDWFLDGKEKYIAREPVKQPARVNSAKISSKQIGDELTNGRKSGETTADGDTEVKGNQTAMAFDRDRMWPLLCFELSISVDQEERIFHQAYRGARSKEALQNHRQQIAAATRMASSLKEAVLHQSHNTAGRSRRTYLNILTPQQTIKFKKWAVANQEKCRSLSGGASRSSMISETGKNRDRAETQTLIDVCKRLEAVLQISKGTNAKVA